MTPFAVPQEAELVVAPDGLVVQADEAAVRLLGDCRGRSLLEVVQTPGDVLDALMAGFAAGRMLELQAPKMIARDFQGRVESRLHHKDIHIVLDLAPSFGIEPARAAVADVLDRLQQRGGARQDSAAVFSILENAQ